jgi:hypothetical protein
MKIQDTDLEVNEVEVKVLDYWLGDLGPDYEEWAKKTWKRCKEKAEGTPRPDGRQWGDVYQAIEGQTWQERANELWENKKFRRTQCLMKELSVGMHELPSIDQHPNYVNLRQLKINRLEQERLARENRQP